MIYHVVSKSNWERSLLQGFYEADSLAKEGFIHASKEHQVAGVLERYYRHQPNLLLLHIDESKLTAALKYEMAASVHEEFPHIFGKLNLDAVVNVTEL
jgi:uncharacterized protein (DUF952 family)